MHRNGSILAASLVLALCACTGSRAEPDEAARLIPPDATVVVRLESVRSWNELVRAFAPLDAELAGYDLRAVLAGLEEREPGDGPAPEVDPERPAYLALTLAPGMPPAYTLVAPVTNGGRFRLFHELSGGKETTASLGNYTGISSAPGYAVAERPCPLVERLGPGVVSAHADMEALLSAYRPLLDTSLRQAELLTDQFPENAQGLMEAYFEMLRAMLDDVRALGLRVVRDGDRLSLEGLYEGRGPARSLATGDPSSLLAFVDPDLFVTAVNNCSMDAYLSMFGGLWDRLVEVFPEPVAGDLDAMVELERELSRTAKPGLAMGFGMEAEGMRAAYVLRASDPSGFLAEVERRLLALDREGGTFRIGAPTDLEVDGVAARVLPLSVDYASAIGSLLPEEELEADELTAMMTAFYGRDLRLALGREGDVVMVVVEPDEARLRTTLARLRAPEPRTAAIDERLPEAPDGALRFAQRVDYARMLARMAESANALQPGTMPELPPSGLTFDASGWWDGQRGEGGLGMRISELVEYLPLLAVLAPR